MKKLLFLIMMVCSIGIAFPAAVRAQEAGQSEGVTELSQLMKAITAVEARQEPDEQAEVVVSYDSGVPVYVTGETANGWYRVLYQDKVGYVRTAELTAQDMDISGLDEEIDAVEMESKMVIEEVERYRSEAKRSRIWGTVIVLLVVGIFATGIISTVKAGKNNKNKETEE